MSETTDLDHGVDLDDGPDWAAADATDDDYLDDDAVAATVEAVVDGTQTTEAGEAGWAGPGTVWQEAL